MTVKPGDIAKLTDKAPDGVKQLVKDHLVLVTALAYEGDTGERKIVVYDGEIENSFLLREGDIEVVSDIDSEMSMFAKILSSGNQA